MRKLIVLVFVAIGLAGCAGRRTPVAYGNFVKGASAVDGKLMADDVAKQLSALYLPARTRINVQHATRDTFGSSLVAALRSRGYAIAEFNQSRSEATVTPGDVALAYVVDQPLESKAYRVTLHLNSQSVSRLYQATGGVIAPAGYWVRKE
jgi:hypothetical protein